MIVRKKRTLLVFFRVKTLNPFFFEVVLDSVRDLNKNLIVKNIKLVKLRQLNKFITLFPIYLNLFSTKKVTPQKNQIKKERKINNNKNLLKFRNKEKFILEVLMKKPNIEQKFLIVDLYLNKSNKISTSQIKKSTEMILNLKNL